MSLTWSAREYEAATLGGGGGVGGRQRMGRAAVGEDDEGGRGDSAGCCGSMVGEGRQQGMMKVTTSWLGRKTEGEVREGV